ncbi:MAG: DoxX family protein [Flavobacterium sp.]
MNNTASILVLLFLAVTFVQSAHDKIFEWKGNVEWLKGHFANTILKNQVPMALAMLLVLELITGVLTLVGCVKLYFNDDRIFGFYGAVLSSITLIIMLLGQRIAKDYDGARTIAIYFVPAVLAVYWLS